MRPYGYFNPSKCRTTATSDSATVEPCPCPPIKTRTEIPGEFAAYWHVGFVSEAPEYKEEVEAYCQSDPQAMFAIVSKYIEFEDTFSAGESPKHLVYIAPVRAGNLNVFVDERLIVTSRSEIYVYEDCYCYFSTEVFTGEHSIRAEPA